MSQKLLVASRLISMTPCISVHGVGCHWQLAHQCDSSSISVLKPPPHPKKRNKLSIGMKGVHCSLRGCTANEQRLTSTGCLIAMVNRSLSYPVVTNAFAGSRLIDLTDITRAINLFNPRVCKPTIIGAIIP